MSFIQQKHDKEKRKAFINSNNVNINYDVACEYIQVLKQKPMMYLRVKTNLEKVKRRQLISCGPHFCRRNFYMLLNYLGKVQLSLFVWCLTTSPFQIDSGLYMHVNFISAATPGKIQLIMNVNSIGRKQISAHLQVHAYCSYQYYMHTT